MTEDTYTEAQIREANFRMLETVFEDDPFTDTTDALITELQRPAWVPAVGEVYAAGKGSSCYVFHGKGFLPATGGRPLTITEHGPAVRALRLFVDGLTYSESCAGLSGDAKRVLKAFDEVVK